MLRCLIVFLVLLCASSSSVEKIQVPIPNSLMLVGKSEEFISLLNDDSVKFIKSMYQRDPTLPPITPQEFKNLHGGEWENIEHEIISPVKLMRVGKHSSKSVELSTGVYIGCIPYGLQAIPAPRSHSAHFFEAVIAEGEKYYDDSNTIVAITSQNHTGCVNGTTLFVPDEELEDGIMQETLSNIIAILKSPTV